MPPRRAGAARARGIASTSEPLTALARLVEWTPRRRVVDCCHDDVATDVCHRQAVQAGDRSTERTSQMADLGPKRIAEFIEPFRVEPGRRVRLPRDFDPAGTRQADQGEAKEILAAGVELLAEYQMRLAAQDTYGVVVVLQAMDAAGKDGTIRHVMSGVNPQGVEVSSFKVPSSEELDHDYLWRYAKRLPERGNIGIFNRSYYEEVLVVRVHPQILAGQKLPPKLKARRHLEPALPRDQRLGALPDRPGLPVRQAVPQRQQGGAAPPVPGPHRRAREELEVQRQRRQGAGVLGRLPEGVQRRARRTRARRGRRGTSSRPTTSRSPGSPLPASSPTP